MEIVVYTKVPCSFCRRAKDLLASKGVEWTEVDVTRHHDRLDEMVQRSGGRRTAPQVFVGDLHLGGWAELRDMNSSGLLDRLLAKVPAGSSAGPSAAGSGSGRPPAEEADHPLEEEGVDDRHRNVIILGSGCAGLTAAIYAARANLEPLVVEGMEFGGQLYTTTDVENFPGFPEGIQGPELIDNMKAQAQRFGAGFLPAVAAETLDLSERPFRVTVTGGETWSCDALIVATGAAPRELGLPNERTLRGRGVSTCATCDGAFFRDVPVAVVGGGDTAMEEALFLTRFASKVWVLHRRDELRASKIMRDRAMANEKIEFLWHTEVGSFNGEADGGLESLTIVDNRTGEERELEVEGCFVAIGHVPNTETLVGSPIRLDEQGYVTPDGHHFPFTAVEGVFVAGDVHDHHYRQAVTAAGHGCRAAIDAERYLERTQDD